MNLLTSYNSTIILICLLYVIIIGLYTARKVSGDSSLYFLAGKKASWKSLSLTLFSLNIPVEYLLVIVISSFTFWWAASPYEAVCLGLVALSMYFLLPLLLEEKITVSQEEFESRFGKRTKLILSSITIVTGIFFRLSLILVTAGVLLYDIMGWNFTTIILLMLLASGVYSVAGGLVSIVNLQLFQFIVLIISFILLISLGFGESFTDLVSGAGFNTILPGEPGFLAGINWFEVLIFMPVFALWYWYNEQDIANKINHTGDPQILSKAFTFSRILKIVPVIFFLLLGLTSRSFSPEAMPGNAAAAFINNDNIYILVRVLILFCIFSSLIIALSSVFVSASARLTKDFFVPVYGLSNSNKIVLFSRFFISVLFIVTIFFVPFTDLRNINSYISLLRYQLYVIAPLAAVYTIILLSNKINSAGIVTGLITGELLVLIRILMDIFVNPAVSSGDVMSWLLNIPALRLALFVFLISVITIITVSRLKTGSIIQFNNLFRKV